MSSIGTLFKVTTFGESHGSSVGCIIENVPSMLKISNSDIQFQLNRRKPNQNSLLSSRNEPDLVEIHSGIQDGVTLGTPICLLVKNCDMKPGDYKSFSNIPRPGHADLTYLCKYGVKSSSGGGRASARETISRVAAGAIADKYLNINFKTEIVSWVNSIGNIEIPKKIVAEIMNDNKITKKEIDYMGTFSIYQFKSSKIVYNKYLKRAFHAECDSFTSDSNSEISTVEIKLENLIFTLDEEDSNMCFDLFGGGGTVEKISYNENLYEYMEDVNVRCPHPETAVKMICLIYKIKSEGDSIGGTVSCVIRNCPRSIGEPCFDKFEAELAKAILSIPATKGFEIGSGFEGTKMK